MCRLFLALWPADELRARIHAWRANGHWPATAALVPPERLHLTLHFLGEVEPVTTRTLQQALPAVPTAPFRLRLDRTALWPGGVAVLEPEEVPQQARSLHAALGQLLQAHGIALDPRPWRAHVTLARKATGVVLPAVPPDLVWNVSACMLVRSMPGGQGYRVLSYAGRG